MAKTVDQFSSIEDFRLQYNQLATDVGEISGLKTGNRLNIVDALNSVEDKVFYFQEFVFTATAAQTSFSGDDDFENTLRFRRNKIQVFVNDKHLDESDDYIIASPQGAAHTAIELVGATYSGGLNLNDKLTLYSFTGSFLGVEIQDALVGYFTENLDGAIYNNNDEGVIINATIADATTVHTYALVGEGEYKIELAGNVYTQGNSLQDGAAEFNSTVGIDGNFRVGSSEASLFDVDAATGNTQIDGTLEVDSTVGIDGDLRVGVDKFNVTAATGDTQIDGTLEVDGTAGVDGNFRVGTGGASFFDVAAATGNTQIDGTLEVDSTVGVDGNFRVGVDKFNVTATTGDTQIDGTLEVDSTAEFNSTVGVDGNFRVGTGGASLFDVAAATGNTQIDGTLEVDSTVGIDGNLRVGVNKFNVTAATGNTQIDGTLEVDSTVGVDGNFRVGVDKFNVTATTGNTTVDGTLDVAGLASLDGGIDVDGAFTVANTTGDISTTGGLDVDGATTLNGAVTLGDASTDTITITGDLGSSITLSTTNVYSIGEPLVKLANVHSTLFTGALTGNVTGNVTGQVSTVANHSMAGLSDVNYTTTPVAGQILAWDNSAGYWEPVNPTNTTDNVSEGSNNKYFTDDRLNAILIGTNGLTKTYVDNANGGADDPLDGTVTFNLDYEVVSTAPVSAGSTSNGHLWFVV